MAKYRVKETSFIHNKIHEEDELVEYEGIPGRNLEPVDAKAKRAATKLAKAKEVSLTRQRFAAAGGDLADPDEAPPGMAGEVKANGPEESAIDELL